jgi:drug/metabolite transporter (DMT)-like permease
MTQPPDRTLPGVALMLVFCVVAPMMDVSAKLASATIPVGQITTARFLLQGVIMLPVAWAMGLSLAVSPRLAAMLALRALFLILATFTFVGAISVMPVADALAITFIEPFIVLILGRLIFGDEVGPRRIAACGVGFAGAMLVIQPSLLVFGTVALLPLLTAFTFAFYMLVTRAISQAMHPVVMQAGTSVAGVLICLPVMLLAEGSGSATLDPDMPQGLAWVWLGGVGVWAAISHICMTYALKFAPSATLAPVHYFEIVTAVALGHAVFGDFPNLLACAGIAVICGSGLYVIHRERLAARRRAAIRAQAHPAPHPAARGAG